MQTEVLSGFEKYNKGVNAFDKRLDARAQEVASIMDDYVKTVKTCGKRKYKRTRARCRQKVKERYDREMTKLDLGGTPTEYWMLEEAVSDSENLLKTVVNGVLSTGATLAVQLIDKAKGGNGGWQDKRYKYTSEIVHYKTRLHPKMAPSFEQETGYPLGLQSLDAFRVHPLNVRKVRAELQKKGLDLPSSWTPKQRAPFNQVVEQKVVSEAKARWKSKSAKKGLAMGPDLSWKAFQQHPDIQKQIKRKVGKDIYVKPMSADWNNAQFYRHVVEPNIKRQQEHALASLKAQRHEFEDGGAYAESAKTALRATLVPPISMGLSLFLVFMTLAKLPLKIYSVMPRVSPLKLWVDLSIKGGTIILILLVPLLFMGSKYTQASSTVGYFLERVEENASKPASLALQWVMLAQPAAQPFGASLNQHLGVMDAFSSSDHLLSLLDQAFFSSRSQRQTVQANPQGKIQFFVKPNPETARIRVMNIGPKYQPGMPLKPGMYDIEVTAPGYKPWRSWVQHNAKSNQFKVTLKKH